MGQVLRINSDGTTSISENTLKKETIDLNETEKRKANPPAKQVARRRRSSLSATPIPDVKDSTNNDTVSKETLTENIEPKVSTNSDNNVVQEDTSTSISSNTVAKSENVCELKLDDKTTDKEKSNVVEDTISKDLPKINFTDFAVKIGCDKSQLVSQLIKISNRYFSFFRTTIRNDGYNYFIGSIVPLPGSTVLLLRTNSSPDFACISIDKSGVRDVDCVVKDDKFIFNNHVIAEVTPFERTIDV